MRRPFQSQIACSTTRALSSSRIGAAVREDLRAIVARAPDRDRFSRRRCGMDADKACQRSHRSRASAQARSESGTGEALRLPTRQKRRVSRLGRRRRFEQTGARRRKRVLRAPHPIQALRPLVKRRHLLVAHRPRFGKRGVRCVRKETTRGEVLRPKSVHDAIEMRSRSAGAATDRRLRRNESAIDLAGRKGEATSHD